MIGGGTVLGVGFNLFQAIGDYRGKRAEGQGKLRAAFGAYLNFRIWSNMPLMIGVAATSAIVPPLIVRGRDNMMSVRNVTAVFSPSGRLPDSQQLGLSQQALMQSAIASNTSLSMSGRSFAGNEAAIMHNKFR